MLISAFTQPTNVPPHMFPPLTQNLNNSPNLPVLLHISSKDSLEPTVLLPLLFTVKYGLTKQNTALRPTFLSLFKLFSGLLQVLNSLAAVSFLSFPLGVFFSLHAHTGTSAKFSILSALSFLSYLNLIICNFHGKYFAPYIVSI